MLMLSGSPVQADGKRGGKDAVEKSSNFMEDEQWLATISQYSRKIKHWNRFRDVSPFERPRRAAFLFLFYFLAYLSYGNKTFTKGFVACGRSWRRVCP